MFFLLVGSLTGILSCLILHYSQHFRLKYCYKQTRSFIIAPATPNLTPKQRLSKVFAGGGTPREMLGDVRNSFAVIHDMRVMLFCSYVGFMY